MRLLVLTALLLLAAAPALAQNHTPANTTPRDTTSVERSYIYFALDQKNPQICAKIFPFAIDSDRLQPSGKQVFYSRSACYMLLALTQLKPEYCKEVRRAPNGFFTQGWYYTEANCEKHAKAEKPLEIAYSMDYNAIMKILGYTEGERKGRSWAQFYQDIRLNQDKSLQTRIDKMLDFTKTMIVEESKWQ